MVRDCTKTYIYYIYIPTLQHKQDAIQRKRFEFRIFLLLDWLPRQGPSQPNYLPKVEFIPFPNVLAMHEMQTALSRIWTAIDMSISSDGNHNITNTNHNNLILFTIMVTTSQCRFDVPKPISVVIHVNSSLRLLARYTTRQITHRFYTNVNRFF